VQLPPHGLSQVPQWFGLLDVSTHSSVHTVQPAGHEHEPLWQISPFLQIFPQEPQCRGLFVVLTHWSEHEVSAPGQSQSLSTQVWPIGQA
jgi:hypothetical protein